jgi:HD domain
VIKRPTRELLHSPQFNARDNDTARKIFLAAARARFKDEEFTKIDKAAELMAESHRGQFRKGTDAPYAIHPTRIALSLLEEFGIVDSELICAALLHDLIEDAKINPEILAQRFGQRCADLVVTLSRLEDEQRGEGGDRLEGNYLQRVVRAGDDAVLLKLADKLDNLRDAAYHPDPSRVKVFVNETFSTYIPLARSISDPRLCARAEKLLLQAAAQTGDPESPEFLRSLLDSIRYSLTANGADASELKDIFLPEIASTLYLHFNPDAQYWVDSDGTSVFAIRTPPLQLAIRIAQSLRELILAGDLESLLSFAGIPVAFASRENRKWWNKTASHLVYIQRLLRDPGRYKWFEVLTSEANLPLLLALIQSRVYLPATWRPPLWAADLGATLSRRVAELSPSPASRLLSRVLSVPLALTRYVQGTGTLSRTESLFDQTDAAQFSPAALWAFRIASEYLDTQTDPAQSNRSTADLEALWQCVHDRPYQSSSLPQRGSEIIDAADQIELADVSQIETTGLGETLSVFNDVGAGDVFGKLLRGLVQTSRNDNITWIHFEESEWKKRRAFWSVFLSHADFAEPKLETGVLLKRKTFQDYEVVTVLPARRFALQDRLPELTSDMLDRLARTGFSATSMFDALVMDQQKEKELWLPRIYRILDTIEDLAPENVQTITISYDGSEPVPPLTAYLPLPDATDDPRQDERKRFIARYLVAQIYTCAVVRWVRRVTFSCAAVNEAQSKHAFTEEELTSLVAEVEREHGYSPAYSNYIERYGYDPFTIAPSPFVSEKLSFGREQIKQGVYLGIDIGGTSIKFELFRDGEPFSGSGQRSLDTPANMEVSEFCREILLKCQYWLVTNDMQWSDLDGIGISWPGAVRKNRLAGTSGVLRGLKEHGVEFQINDPINRLPTLQLASYFRKELQRIAKETGSKLDQNLTVAIQNDGDAEALGNHALRLMRGEGSKGGKIFIKLGTSVAGGRITNGGVVAEEVAEYAKVILNLNTPADPKWPGGTARYYTSAVGVRQLSRTFEYEGKCLFGSRDGLNEEKHHARIEPVELGTLLPLFAEIDGRKDFLNKLVQFDNHPPLEITQRMSSSLVRWLKSDGRDKLLECLTAREEQRALPAGALQSNLERTIWLCTGQDISRHAPPLSELAADFPVEDLARTVVGSVCLFSQLALQLSHLIAQLYNIYRRGTFSEVILSGGVIGGETGKLVEEQTRAFLNKYYDKIYGTNRPLASGAVARAHYDNVSNAGIFGAALAANRMRQVTLAQSLAQTISYRLKQYEIGEEVCFAELIEFPSFPQSLEVGRSVVESAVMAGSLVWINPNVLQRIR